MREWVSIIPRMIEECGVPVVVVEVEVGFVTKLPAGEILALEFLSCCDNFDTRRVTDNR